MKKTKRKTSKQAFFDRPSLRLPRVGGKAKPLPSTLDKAHAEITELRFQKNKNYLAKMVNMQYKLMSKLDLLPSDNPKKRRKQMNDILTQIVHEAEECRDHLDWKSHKKYPKVFEFKESKFIEENTDILFFILELYIFCNCTSPDIYGEYKKKMNKNLKRKEFNYGAKH